MSRKACHGELTLEDGDFRECLDCGIRVRWDMLDDVFWGFHTCPDAPQAEDAVARCSTSQAKPTIRVDVS